MTKMKRKLGTVSVGNYYHDRIFWLDIIKHTFNDTVEYKLNFCIPQPPDNYISPKINTGFIDKQFEGYTMGGGMRYREYYKISLNLDTIDELKFVIDSIIKNPLVGIFKFKLTKDVEHIINEYRIGIL